MTQFARIEANTVVELFTPPDGVPISDCFVPAIAQSFVEVPDGVDVYQGCTYDGTTFTAPVPPAPPEPTADQLLAQKIAAGIGFTCTSNPGLDAVYALDDVSTGQIFQMGLYAAQFGVFPGGATQAYPDVSGVPHVFSVDQFVAFLRVVAPMVAALNNQAAVMAHGGSPVWPQQTAVIA